MKTQHYSFILCALKSGRDSETKNTQINQYLAKNKRGFLGQNTPFFHLRVTEATSSYVSANSMQPLFELPTEKNHKQQQR
jgi:hypothetical protein